MRMFGYTTCVTMAKLASGATKPRCDPESDREYRQRLSDVAYRVTRHGETEPAFSGEYVSMAEEGFYKCVCCEVALFSSGDKMACKHGWPSFRAGSVEHLAHISITKLRTEVRCKICDAHLGHVSKDSQSTSGQRYCINSCALTFTR